MGSPSQLRTQIRMGRMAYLSDSGTSRMATVAWHPELHRAALTDELARKRVNLMCNSRRATTNRKLWRQRQACTPCIGQTGGVNDSLRTKRIVPHTEVGLGNADF